MKLLKTVLVIVFSAFFMVSCGQNTADNKSSDKSQAVLKKPVANVIAYSMGDNIEQVKQYPLNKLTHIIYSFLHLQGNELAFDNPQSQQMVRSLVGLKKEFPHLKIMVALGGWGGCETCSDVFSSETGQKEFIASARKIIQEYQLDGLDLDWEYPVVEGFPEHHRSPQDKDNFSSLVQGLRESLGEESLITFAAGGYNEYLMQAIDWPGVIPNIDWVNLMSYDLINGYSTVTGHHTPLYSSARQIESTDNAVSYLLNAKVPSNKIVIGAAFYARVWQNVVENNHGLFQDNSKFMMSIDFKKLDAFFTEHEFEQYWDGEAQAPYAYSAKKRLFATYENAKSLTVKTDYVKNQNLNGIMFWQLGSDKTHAGLVDAIYRNLSEP